MHTRRCLMLLSGLATLLCLGAGLRAQSMPTPLSPALTTTVSLSPEQVQEVNGYVKAWAELLNATSSTPSDVERARNALVYNFVQPNARSMSPNFRGTYSSAAVPAMEAALKGQDIHRAANAILVLAQVGTDRASNVLTFHSDLQNQPVWQIRLRAADGERILLQGGQLDGRKTADAAKRMREAASREDNGLVLRHQFEALLAADSDALTQAERTTVRTQLADAVAAAAKKTAGQEAVSQPDVIALAAVVADLRNRYLAAYGTDQSAIGAKLGPALGLLLDWSRSHWDALRADPELTRQAGILVNACEGLLQSIDPVVTGRSRPTPTTDLRNAWTAGDKAKFETGVVAWQEVLTKAPYKP